MAVISKIVRAVEVALLPGTVDWISFISPYRTFPFLERDRCQNFTTSLIQNRVITGNETDLFAKDITTGLLLSSSSDMVLTLGGCEALCGPRSFYVDSGPRFMTWVLPITLLLSNIELCPTDKRRYSTLIEVLGNPIDSLWNLTHKLQTWNGLYYFASEYLLKHDKAHQRTLSSSAKRRTRYKILRSANFVRKICGTEVPNLFRTLWGNKVGDMVRGRWDTNIQLREHVESDKLKAARRKEEDIMRQKMRLRVGAIVLSGFEELLGGEAAMAGFYDALMTELWSEENYIHWVKAAGQLAGARTDQFLRTLLAVSIYVFQVASTFVQGVGGDPPTPPGGIIASALFLSYLVPVAVLSNCIGAFTDRRTCLRIISDLVENTAPNDIHERPIIASKLALITLGSPQSDETSLMPNLDLSKATSWDHYFHQSHFSGGNPTYRPFKIANLKDTWSIRKIIFTVIWSSTPVLAGFAGAFPILLYAVPIGFSCRHIWLLLVFILTLFSLLFSLSLHNIQWGPPHRRWLAILTKDFFIGIGSLLVIVISAIGGFNSCVCWGRAWWVDNPVVSLMTEEFYKLQNQTTFPWIVTPVLVFQLFFCGVVIAANWRGVYVVRWSEDARRWAWEEEQRVLVEGKRAVQKEAMGEADGEVMSETVARTEEGMVKTKQMPVVSTREVPVPEASPGEEAQEGFRMLPDSTAPSVDEEFHDAQARITEDNGNSVPAENVEPVRGTVESHAAAQQPQPPDPAPDITVAVDHEGQPHDKDPEFDHGNFQLQKYNRRYFMILWKDLTKTSLPQSPPRLLLNLPAPSAPLRPRPDPSPDLREMLPFAQEAPFSRTYLGPVLTMTR